jgi:hypothetical protein
MMTQSLLQPKQTVLPIPGDPNHQNLNDFLQVETSTMSEIEPKSFVLEVKAPNVFQNTLAQCVCCADLRRLPASAGQSAYRSLFTLVGQAKT